MFNFIYLILLNSKTFNPYGLKSIDNDMKLTCQINEKEFIIKLFKDNLWSVALFNKDLSDWEEYNYISQKNLNRKPSKIIKLLIANQLITKYLKNEHKKTT